MLTAPPNRRIQPTLLTALGMAEARAVGQNLALVVGDTLMPIEPETAQLLSAKFIRDALILWATIDPISTMLVYMSLTADFPVAQRRRIAAWATIYASLILLVAIVIGQIILTALGVTMVAFQVAGGIVLFLFSVQLIFGNLTMRIVTEVPHGRSLAVFPLATPSIATPGAIMAVIVLTDNHLYSIPIQVGTAAITISILVITYVLMRAASPILKIIGRPGAEMIVRVMGLLLAALSVQLMFDAIGFNQFTP